MLFKSIDAYNDKYYLRDNIWKGIPTPNLKIEDNNISIGGEFVVPIKNKKIIETIEDCLSMVGNSNAVTTHHTVLTVDNVNEI
jgi:hypothetical protein